MKPIYDKETLSQLKNIDQDNKDIEHDRRFENIEEDLAQKELLHSDLKVKYHNLETRIKTLEDAREVQKRLNAVFDEGLSEDKPDIQLPKPPFWFFLKK